MNTCNSHATTTSCYTHQGQSVNLYHSGTKILQTIPTGIKINAGQLVTVKPVNPIHGDLFLDEKSNKLMVWDGTAWIAVNHGEEENIIDQFDVVTDDGFFKVKLCEHSTNGKKSVIIYEEDNIFLGSTKESLDFLKQNLQGKYYLWVEKRILNHLS